MLLSENLGTRLAQPQLQRLSIHNRGLGKVMNVSHGDRIPRKVASFKALLVKKEQREVIPYQLQIEVLRRNFGCERVDLKSCINILALFVGN